MVEGMAKLTVDNCINDDDNNSQNKKPTLSQLAAAGNMAFKIFSECVQAKGTPGVDEQYRKEQMHFWNMIWLDYNSMIRDGEYEYDKDDVNNNNNSST